MLNLFYSLLLFLSLLLFFPFFTLLSPSLSLSTFSLLLSLYDFFSTNLSLQLLCICTTLSFTYYICLIFFFIQQTPVSKPKSKCLQKIRIKSFNSISVIRVKQQSVFCILNSQKNISTAILYSRVQPKQHNILQNVLGVVCLRFLRWFVGDSKSNVQIGRAHV